MLTLGVVDRWIDAHDCCPWTGHAGRSALHPDQPRHARDQALYTPDERRRRDASPWTLVQAVLAPIQFGVFLISLFLVLRYLATGEGLALATASIVLKTLVLYAIMITGSIWEREVFGRYLFARPFFWEDVVSILVLALHTAYLVALVSGAVDVPGQMLIALAAYAAYVINATQFVLKLRAARREQGARPGETTRLPGLAG
jgi:3-vinyl bacteriochlorophyllide hydratase